MVNKMTTAEKAVEGIKDGMTIMVGGFLGTGTPEILVDALVKKGVKHLTVICNDGGLPVGFNNAPTARGVAKLIDAGMVGHLIASHVGLNPKVAELMNSGKMKCTFVPQGTLVEKIRSGAYGLGGVLTPTGIGTPVQDDRDEWGNFKEILVLQGRKYLLELPLHADYSLVRASICDTYGNFRCDKATKNFNYIMAHAADKVVLASEKVYQIGEKRADAFFIPGVVVDMIVEGEPKWQI